MSYPTIQQLATEASSFFETARRATGDTDTGPREDGEEYVRTRDGCPEWVQQLVYDAHDEMLPDDWRYQCIAAALVAIAGADDIDDVGHEFADGHADVYTGALTAWLGSHGSRPGYCDEAREDYGWDEERGIVGLIQLGQYAEAFEVFESVKYSLEQRQSAIELDELTEA